MPIPITSISMTTRAAAGVVALFLLTAAAAAAAQLDLALWAVPAMILAGLACGAALTPRESWVVSAALAFACYATILLASIEAPLFGSIAHIDDNFGGTAAALRTDRDWRVAVELVSDRAEQPRRGPLAGRTLVAPVVPPNWTIADPVPAWAIASIAVPSVAPPAEWRRSALELLRMGPAGQTDCRDLVRIAVARHALRSPEPPHCFRWTADAAADLHARRSYPLLAWMIASGLWLAAIVYAVRRRQRI